MYETKYVSYVTLYRYYKYQCRSNYFQVSVQIVAIRKQ